jgi:hypothetical protein
VAKAKALEIWQRKDLDQLDGKISAALAWQARVVFGQCEWDKIPHPATWLNQARWEDEQPRRSGSFSPSDLPEV